MNKWSDIWDIMPVKEDIKRLDGTVFEKTRWYVVDKVTREKLMSKTRPYGYSDQISAKNGAAHRFRHLIKIMEKELLGKR